MAITRYIWLLVLVVITTEVVGQKTFQPKSTELEWKGIVYRRELAGEVRVHTNGFLVGVNVGKINAYNKTSYYHFSVGMLKDPREKKQNRNLSFRFPDRSRSFTFGKQNSVIALRGSKGVRKYLSEKAKRKGIAVGYDYSFGPSIALLKPSYLEIIKVPENGPPNQRTTESVKYSEETADVFLSFNDIYGGSGFAMGLDEISIVPGIQGKLGVFFSVGAFDEVVKSVELGIMGDLYIRPLAIMVETDQISNKPYFVNLYANFTFGKRKN